MSVGLETAAAKILEVAEESKQKDTEIEQLKRLMETIRADLEVEREKNKAFMEYEDIILDPDIEKDWQSVTIRSGKTFKDLTLRCQKLYENTRPITMAALVENMLNFACSNMGFRQVLRHRYPDKPEAQRILGITPDDGDEVE